jgi:hypothetical protein
MRRVADEEAIVVIGASPWLRLGALY